jgi:hypothetical protein
MLQLTKDIPWQSEEVVKNKKLSLGALRIQSIKLKSRSPLLNQ